jgi:hypothetical protein
MPTAGRFIGALSWRRAGMVQFTRRVMLHKPFAAMVCALAASVWLAASGGQGLAQTNPKCDPVDPIADAGWSVVPSLETIAKADGAPYQSGPGGDWFIDRITTLLPFCNYYNEIGIYSMRSYTLSRQVSKEQVQICRAAPGGASVAIVPYAGPCPPK